VIAEPLFYAVAVPAILLTGLSKGGFGAGAGILAVPMMALAIPPVQAAAVMLPVLCLMDAIGIWGYRQRFDRARLRVLLPAAVVGIAVGTLSFGLLSEAAIRLVIGLIAVAFVLDRWRGAAARAAGTGRPPPGPLAGGFWAAVSGYTSFVAHAGGPPLSVYLLPQRLDKSVFVGTTVVFFAVVNAAKVPPYWLLGQFTAENLATSLALAPLAPVGMALGFLVHRMIRPEVFFRICYTLVLLTGTKLVYDGLAGLAGT